MRDLFASRINVSVAQDVCARYRTVVLSLRGVMLLPCPGTVLERRLFLTRRRYHPIRRYEVPCLANGVVCEHDQFFGLFDALRLSLIHN